MVVGLTTKATARLTRLLLLPNFLLEVGGASCPPLFIHMNYQTAKGWLTESEREFLYLSAQRCSPQSRILNIGVEFGASLVCLLEGNATASIVGVDIDMSKYVGPLSSRLLLYEGSSHSYLRGCIGSSIDFAFIDGDHTFEGAYQDAKLCAPLISSGGLISFHDCYTWDEPGKIHKIVPEVNMAVQKWFDENNNEFSELPFIDSIRVFRKE